MAFTAQLLKGCTGSDIVKVVNRYLSPKNADFEQLCKLGLVEQVLIHCRNNTNYYNIGFKYACENDQLEIAKFMIKNGSNYWRVGLEKACYNGHLDIVKLIIDAADVNGFKEGIISWNEGLIHACRGEENGNIISKKIDGNNTGYVRTEIVKLMIKKGANNLNMAFLTICENGSSKHIHSQSIKMEIVNLMIDLGVNNWNGGLMSACMFGGNTEIAKLMIEKGADDLNTGLRFACGSKEFENYNHKNCLELINLLIKNGANDWNMGLYFACQTKNSEIAKLMIEKGATYCSNCTDHTFI
jgi:ankyrin repeat protein